MMKLFCCPILFLFHYLRIHICVVHVWFFWDMGFGIHGKRWGDIFHGQVNASRMIIVTV